MQPFYYWMGWIFLTQKSPERAFSCIKLRQHLRNCPGIFSYRVKYKGL